MKDKILGGIIGLCVGDALGVPVEFNNRESLTQIPATDIRGYGTHNQPPGTWSDDTSMSLCLIDSLIDGLNYTDIMNKFLSWINNADYTAHGEVFDIGVTTRKALNRFANGIEPLLCGDTSEYDNGNGSLMRILPLVFYLKTLYGDNFIESGDAINIIHNVSALTHAHKRSQIACSIYLSIAEELSRPNCMITSAIWKARRYYEFKNDYTEELKHFYRIFDDNFISLPQDKIKSSGYVVDTLEAALWCLLNTDNYKDCVLKAVNLGEDTDTVAAIAGGLAGMQYGLNTIPEKWLNQIPHLDYIKELCDSFYISLNKTSAQLLCKYIPFFENIDPEVAYKWLDNDYDETVWQFEQDFYNSCLQDYSYSKTIEDRIPDVYNTDICKVIESADIELLKALLTKCIRNERFCDRAWVGYIIDGVFLAILRRLEALLLE